MRMYSLFVLKCWLIGNAQLSGTGTSNSPPMYMRAGLPCADAVIDETTINASVSATVNMNVRVLLEPVLNTAATSPFLAHGGYARNAHPLRAKEFVQQPVDDIRAFFHDPVTRLR